MTVSNPNGPHAWALWRIESVAGARWAVGAPADGPAAVLPEGFTLSSLLDGTQDFTAYRNLPVEPLPPKWRLLAPLDEQEVWAAGVTFIQSRYAREAESSAPDFYREVYFADRPELFLKASPGTAVGSEDAVGIRADSSWNVPEPELALVVDAQGQVVAFTLGNDVSSRSIEGENPLYLPQAKVYDQSCAIGPCLVPVGDVGRVSDIEIRVSVHRAGAAVFDGSGPLSDLKRDPADLVRWLFAARSFSAGVVLLCGTSIVPPDEFTLLPGDEIQINAPQLGALVNTVTQVGEQSSERTLV